MIDWKPVNIEGYERYRVSKDGAVYGIHGNKLSIQVKSGGGQFVYLRPTKGTYNSNSKVIGVAKLVALTYIPNPNNLPHVIHKDGNRSNNQVSNLAWSYRTDRYNTDSNDSGNKANGGNTRALRVYNLYTMEELLFSSIKEFAEYMAQIYKAKTLKQHFRSINHYLSFKLNCIIYYDYKIVPADTNLSELTKDEVDFNLIDYISLVDICKMYGVDRKTIMQHIQKHNVKLYRQLDDIWVNQKSFDTFIGNVLIADGKVYDRGKYNLQAPDELCQSSHMQLVASNKGGHLAKPIVLTNLINGVHYTFNSLSDCAEYLCKVFKKNKKNSKDLMIQTISKKLHYNSSKYKFFDIQLQDEYIEKEYNIPQPVAKDFKTVPFKSECQRQCLYEELCKSSKYFPYPYALADKEKFSLYELVDVLKLPYSVLVASIEYGVLPVTFVGDTVYVTKSTLVDFINDIRKMNNMYQ